MANFLQNDFYTIAKDQIDVENGQLHVRVRINADHHIFRGHFPGNPVVPGVCMIQILKEVLSNHLKKELTLHEIGNVKFMSFIDPKTDPVLEIQMVIKSPEAGEYHVSASILAGEKKVLKFQGRFS